MMKVTDGSLACRHYSLSPVLHHDLSTYGETWELVSCNTWCVHHVCFLCTHLAISSSEFWRQRRCCNCHGLFSAVHIFPLQFWSASLLYCGSAVGTDCWRLQIHLLCPVLHYALSNVWRDWSTSLVQYMMFSLCICIFMYTCCVLEFRVLKTKKVLPCHSLLSAVKIFCYRIVFCRPSILWHFLLEQIAEGRRFTCCQSPILHYDLWTSGEMRELSHVILDVFTMYVNLCTHVGLMSLSSDDNWRRSNTVTVCCQLYKFFVHRVLICRLEQVSKGYGLTRERVHDNCYNCFGPFMHLINGLEFK